MRKSGSRYSSDEELCECSWCVPALFVRLTVVAHWGPGQIEHTGAQVSKRKSCFSSFFNRARLH